MCEKTGPQLTDDADLLFLQVRPDFIEDGVPSSQAFRPHREIDDGCLSVDRAKRTTAEQAYARFTDPSPKGFEMKSAGVWGMTVEEAAAAEVTSWEDEVKATPTTPANDAHALLEFGDVGNAALKRKAQILKSSAVARGILYEPPCAEQADAAQLEQT